MKRSGWEVVIGLEIHVQLLTQSKIFSGSSTRFGAAPNTQASAIDLGLPGVLPMVNEAVYRKAVTFGLAIDAKINHRSVFDRKNYFYPDLPKGYQITQLNYPIVEAGKIHITLPDGNIKPIAITRAHLEEDAGKSLHTGVHDQTGIDLNRAGIPLLEIVSEPDMRSSREAVAYAKIIHQLVTYLGISDGDMSQGSLRCDINVSVRPLGQVTLGTRTETKNVNSFRYMKSAIEFEIDRQITLLEAGGSIKQETRLYDSDRDETRPMRDKETSTDYRYFPEPDLLPVVIDDAYIEAIRATLPELPQQKIHRFISQYGITAADAKILATSRQLADYFESVVTIGGDARLAANWVRGDLLGQLHKAGLSISQSPVAAAELGYVMRKISDASISGKIAKKVFAALWQGEATTAASYIEQQGLIQVSGSALTPLVDEVIAANPKQVEQYRAGKTKLMGFFVGQAMQLIQGKANPKQLNELLQKKLNE